jgi:hypothetical protein
MNMSNTFNLHLVKALVDAALLFEFSEESVMDSDLSIEAMEAMAAELQLMSETEKSVFCSQLEVVAKGYSGAASTFILEMPVTFGLIDDEDDSE